MDESEVRRNGFDLAEAISTYAESLNSLSTTSKVSYQQVLKVLRSRDRVQELLPQTYLTTDECSAKLVELDLKLKQHRNAICQTEHFEQLRESFQPPQSSWWWHLTLAPETSSPKPFSARFDWIWNVGTVVCLVLSTSFITQTAKAFSTEGFDFLGTLSTITQGAGIAFLAGGALTDKGRQAVSQTLVSVKIPPSLHAEVTFGAALVLLGASYGINQNLNIVGGWYFQKGQYHEAKGEWSQAFKGYQRALTFAPDDYKTQIAVGFLHERLGNFEQAVNEYKKGSAFGIPEFLNAQARVTLMGAFEKNNWQVGVNEKAVLEAHSLLQRAERSIHNYEADFSKTVANQRLYGDILVNQALVKIASLSPNQKPDKSFLELIDEVTQNLAALERVTKRSKSTQSTELTQLSTVGSERTACYFHIGNIISNRIRPINLYGTDLVNTETDRYYSCVNFSYSSSNLLQSDNTLITNLKLPDQRKPLFSYDNNIGEGLLAGNPTALMRIIYFHREDNEFGLDYRGLNINQVILIKDPNVWIKLSSEISQRVPKKTFEKDNKKGKIILRVLLSRTGDILAVFSYDQRSSDLSQILLEEVRAKEPLKKLANSLKLGKPLEFADFKVVVSTEGKLLHILPWALAYPAANQGCEKRCRNLFLEPQVRQSFKDYVPDLQDSAELASLQAVINMQLASLAISLLPGFNYREAAVFKLKVSSDGQVVNYQAGNEFTKQKFGKGIMFLDLKSIQFPQLQKPPYAYFKLESKGIAWRVATWSD